MPKVKIFMSHEYPDYYECSAEIITHGISDWEEITDEEYDYLRRNLYKLSDPKYGRPVIIIQSDKTALEYIDSIKNFIAEEKRKVEEAKRLREEKKAKAAAKKQQDLEAKELKKFKELAKKYGKDVDI